MYLTAVLLAASVLAPAPHPDSKSPTVNPALKTENTEAKKESRRAQLEIIAATLELRDRYSDFAQFEPRIAELADEFLPGKGVTPLTYLEGLYFIAKRSTVSPAAESRQR
jgi:hypothetical protein